jgi:23S rRNA (adenine2030-N6)-methyltransferase
MFAVWYPLMAPAAMRSFDRDVERTGIGKVLRLELLVRKRDAGTAIPGCGMLVVNPPWKFEAEARPLLDWLWRALTPDGAGGVKVDWLAPEQRPASRRLRSSPGNSL